MGVGVSRMGNIKMKRKRIQDQLILCMVYEYCSRWLDK
jgi:hypothetical protein